MVVDRKIRENQTELTLRNSAEHHDHALIPIPDFLSNVLARARQQDRFDEGLLRILEAHVVREEPHGDAVARALADIRELAEQRLNERD